MSVAHPGAVAPILKIRAALRERAAVPACAAPNVVSITDGLMLGWAESEISARRSARTALVAAEHELADLRALCTELVAGRRELTTLERLLVFTKLESARGLARQAFDTVALCSLALVVWAAVAGADGSSADYARGPRAIRLVRVQRREGEGAA